MIFASGERRLRIAFVTQAIARITFTEGRPFQARQSIIVKSKNEYVGYRLNEDENEFTVSTPSLTVVVSKKYGAIRFFDANGRLLMQEPEREIGRAHV